MHIVTDLRLNEVSERKTGLRMRFPIIVIRLDEDKAEALPERARRIRWAFRSLRYDHAPGCVQPVLTSAHLLVDRAAYEAAFERLRAAGLTVRMSSQARVEANGGCGTLVAIKRRSVCSLDRINYGQSGSFGLQSRASLPVERWCSNLLHASMPRACCRVS